MANDVSLKDTARRVLAESLGVTAKERVLFFSDFNSPHEERYALLVERRRFLHEFYEAFSEVGGELCQIRYDKYESTGKHGGEPRENVWRLAFGESIYGKLLDHDLLWKLKGEVDLAFEENSLIEGWLKEFAGEVVDAVVAFPWYSMTHTRFTRLLRGTGCRIASMPLLTQTVVEGPLTADWNEVAATTQRVYDAILACHRLHLTCPVGTDLSLEVGPPAWVHKDTGLLRQRGSLGNLPAGEAYMVPAVGSATGTIVFTSGPERPKVEPTAAVVENGKVAFFRETTDYSQILDERFHQDFRFRHVAELGIGTNPQARDVSSMIEGEKIQGTVHIALGDDKSMGGSNEATEHWDHILVDVTLEGAQNDGETITFIRNGRLLI
jgi:aminopeptidase